MRFILFVILSIPLMGFAKTVDESALIATIVKSHKLPEDFVKSAFTKAQKDQSVIDAIKRPWEAKPWHKYYPIFLTDKRVAKGVKFWQNNKALLAKAENQFGIPAEIIVSILGVESFFGTYLGKYSVLDTLYTLAVHYPKRSKFFAKELGHYLALCHEQGFDFTEMKGSYAGAMGWGQFISSSYRHYAIDFDNDNKADLFNSPADAIGSVANYFAKHRWQPEQPIAFKATMSDAESKPFITKSLKPKVAYSKLSPFLVEDIDTKATSNNVKVKLIKLRHAESNEYWIGFHNFYVITRYNHSPLYAMAVFQLGEQIKAAYGENAL